MEVERLNREVLRLSVEYRDSAAMVDWHFYRHHPKSAGLLFVKSVGKFGLLQHTKINLYLHQPAMQRFHNSVHSASDIICAKPHHFLRPTSVPPPFPGTSLYRVSHPLPQVNFFSTPV